MKKALLLLGFFAFLSTLHAQVLVAYYPFNGNANDATGNGHNGTVNGPVLSTDRFGNTNSAYNFDGIDDYIDANADNLPTNDRTVSLWFNADVGSIGFSPGIFGYGGGSCGSSFFMSINNPPSALLHYQTQGHCNSNQLLYAYPVVPENRWYNWVVTISGNTILFYINGQQVAANSAIFTIPTNVAGTKVSIGAIPGPGGTSNYTDANVGRFRGKIDDIRIYDAAMTEAEVFDAFVNDTRMPGSGNSIILDGTDDYFSTPTTGFTGIQTYTIEFWFKRSANPSLTDFVFENGSALSSPSFEAGAGQPFNYYVGNSNAISSGPIVLGTWYHVACQYDKINQVQRLYVNGVLKGSTNVDVSDAIQSTLFFGSRQGSQYFLNGEIDEIRVWEVVLTEAQIRDWMCRKISPLHPQWNDLRLYLRLDRANGNTVYDLKSLNDATLFNGATLKTSGASIGDASAYDYSATPSVTLAHPQGETFQATTTSGAPVGIQVYRVDEAPNHINGAPGIGANNRYFGVHMVEGITPQYTVTYNYTGNPFVNTTNEDFLTLYKRDNNDSPVWTDAAPSLNTTSNTLVATGQTTEYILGLISGVLPVNYLSFNARKVGNTVRLDWETTVEINNGGFEVQRSKDGNSYSGIGWVPGSGNSTAVHSYTFSDNTPSKGKNYYRLKQRDNDGRTKMSEVRLINFALSIHVIVFPNPATDLLYIALGNDNITEMDILNAAGQKVWGKQGKFNNYLSVSLNNIASGVYFLRVTNSRGEQIVQNFIRK